MVWGSLRFDDALLISPRDINMREEGLQVWSWQTKVERARRGTRTIVCRASLSVEDRLSQGWDLWRQLCPPSYFQSDFLFEHALDGPHYSTPAGYTGFVFNMRAALAHVLLQDSVSEEVRVKLSPLIHKFTAHCLRCTVVSALAKQRVDPVKIQLQRHWKNSSMVAKYTRDREQITTQSIQSLVSFGKADK